MFLLLAWQDNLNKGNFDVSSFSWLANVYSLKADSRLEWPNNF